MCMHVCTRIPANVSRGQRVKRISDPFLNYGCHSESASAVSGFWLILLSKFWHQQFPRQTLTIERERADNPLHYSLRVVTIGTALMPATCTQGKYSCTVNSLTLLGDNFQVCVTYKRCVLHSGNTFYIGYMYNILLWTKFCMCLCMQKFAPQSDTKGL